MPTIPALGAPTVRPAPRASRMGALESYGVDQTATQAIAGGLADVAAAHEREMQRLDEIRANEAEAALTSQATDLWTGYANQRGTKAVEGLDGFRDGLTRRIREQEGALVTERQKLLFRSRADRIAQDLEGRAQAHAAGEVRAVDRASHEALLAADREAILNTPDLAQATDIITRAVNRLTLYGDRNGMPPEAIQQGRIELRSNLRLAQVAALVNAGGPLAIDRAATVLTDQGDQFTAEDRAKADAMVGEAQERDAIQSAASRILSTAKTATEAYEMTKSIEDLGTRQSVRKLVEAEFAAKEEAQKRDQEQVYTNAANLVDAAPNRPARAVIPPAQWAQLSVPQREALERRATAPANDNRAWFAFYSMKPEDRAKLTPAEFQTQFWSKFDEAHRTRAEGLYQDSTKDRSGGAVGILTDNERVRSTLVSMHLVSKPLQRDWSDADYTFATAFEQEADTRIRALEASLGRKADATEKQDIVTTLGWEMAPINVRGQSLREQSGLPITTRDYTSTQVEVRERGLESQAYVPYEQIPEAVRRQYTRALEANGRAVTRKVIEDAYGAFLMKNLGRRDTLLGIPLPPGTF